MRDYSEFVQFVIEKTGLNKSLLIERDVLLHSLLYRLSRDEEFKRDICLRAARAWSSATSATTGSAWT